MLVLTRKLQQQIKIGDNVTITILKVKGAAVQIGIDAPKDVRILRKELPVTALELAETELSLIGGDDSESSQPLMLARPSQPIVRTEFPANNVSADKNNLKATHAASRKSPRFNMPPLKLAVSIPTLAK